MYPATPGTRCAGTVQITFISLPLTWRTITMTLSEYFLYQCPYSSLMDAMRWWIQSWVLKKRVLWAVVWFLLLNRGIHNKNFSTHAYRVHTHTYVHSQIHTAVYIFSSRAMLSSKLSEFAPFLDSFIQICMYVIHLCIHMNVCVCVLRLSSACNSTHQFVAHMHTNKRMHGWSRSHPFRQFLRVR